MRIRLRLHQCYGNACQFLVRANVLFAGVVQFGGVNTVIVLVHPNQTANGTAAYLDGCRGAGEQCVFLAAGTGKVDIIVGIIALLYRFVVAVRQQGIYAILGLGHGQFHMDFNSRVGQPFQLEIQAAQLALTRCLMDGHGIRGKGDAVVLGVFGGSGKQRSVAAGLLHRSHTVQHVGGSADGGAHQQAALFIPGGVGVDAGLLDILDGNESF